MHRVVGHIEGEDHHPEAERALGLTQSELENQLLYATAVPCNADGSSFEQLLHHVNQGIPYKSNRKVGFSHQLNNTNDYKHT